MKLSLLSIIPKVEVCDATEAQMGNWSW